MYVIEIEMDSGSIRYYSNDAMSTSVEDATHFIEKIEAENISWDVNNWYNVKETRVLNAEEVLS